ncbi:MAG: thioredoxin family protein [Shewanella sp.]
MAKEKGMEIALQKETRPEAIMNYHVMSTPAVVIDEQVVHWGSIPTRQMIESWLAE